MTTEPNAPTVSINQERMPVLLSEEAEFDTWDAFALARSLDPARMRIVQSGKDKEDVLGQAQTIERPPALL